MIVFDKGYSFAKYATIAILVSKSGHMVTTTVQDQRTVNGLVQLFDYYK